MERKQQVGSVPYYNTASDDAFASTAMATTITSSSSSCRNAPLNVLCCKRGVHILNTNTYVHIYMSDEARVSPCVRLTSSTRCLKCAAGYHFYNA